MATKIYKAVVAGDVSTLAIWEVFEETSQSWVSATQLPTVDDDVYANGYILQITQDFDAKTLLRSELAPYNIVAGGQFQVDNVSVKIKGNIEGQNTGVLSQDPASACLFIKNNGTAEIKGDVVGGSGTLCFGIVVFGTAIVENSNGGNGMHSFGAAVYGSLTVNHNVNGGEGQSANGVIAGDTSTVEIAGDATGGSGTEAHGVSANNSSTVKVAGDANGGSGEHAHGVIANNSSTVEIAGDATGGSGQWAIGLNITDMTIATLRGDANGGSELGAWGIHVRGNAKVEVLGSAIASSTESAIAGDYDANITLKGGMKNYENIPGINARRYVWEFSENTFFEIVRSDNTVDRLEASVDVQEIAEAVCDELESRDLGKRLKECVTTEILGNTIVSFND